MAAKKSAEASLMRWRSSVDYLRIPEYASCPQ